MVVPKVVVAVLFILKPSIILLLIVVTPPPTYNPVTLTPEIELLVFDNPSTAPNPVPIVLLVILLVPEPEHIIPAIDTVVSDPIFALLVVKPLIILLVMLVVALPPIFIPLTPPIVPVMKLFVIFAITFRVIFKFTPVDVAFIPKKILFVTKFKLLGTVKLPIILLSIFTAPPVALIPVNCEEIAVLFKKIF